MWRALLGNIVSAEGSEMRLSEVLLPRRLLHSARKCKFGGRHCDIDILTMIFEFGSTFKT